MIAGGGEGTVEAALSAGGERRVATSRGTVKLVLAAMDAGAKSIVVGLGGSACTDGGAGLLAAVEARLTDAGGSVIADGGGALMDLAAVEPGDLDPRLLGAGAAEVVRLERAMSAWARCLHEGTGRDPAALDWGSPAAGGTAAGLHAAVGAHFQSGLEVVAELSGLADQLRWADRVIVGGRRSEPRRIGRFYHRRLFATGRDSSRISMPSQRHGLQNRSHRRCLEFTFLSGVAEQY